MRYTWMSLASLLFIVVLAACQPMDPVSVVPAREEAPTITPGSVPESTQTQSPAGELAAEETTMDPQSTPDPTGQKMVDLAKEHLARKLDLPVEQIALFEVEAVEWPDASLGCPRSGFVYAQVLTSGFRVLLEASGQLFTYHTDEGEQVILCEARPPDEIFPTP